ncbi:MAG: hypothetical protein ACOYU5_04410 [Stygiobacter sp.]
MYLVDLNYPLAFNVEEIMNHRNFLKASDLLILFRLISSESHSTHPNKFMQTLIKMVSYNYPLTEVISNLIETFFYKIIFIDKSIIKAVYLHHEFVRIHTFSDENSRAK